MPISWDSLPQLRLPPLPNQPERFATLAEVFGISRNIPYNYVSRDAIDGKLSLALSRNRHVVIHGSSKQGKTCLRKWNLNEDSYVPITCNNRWTLRDINVAILKAAGFTISLSDTKTETGENKLTAKSELKISALGLEGSGSLEGSTGSQTQDSSTTANLELDPTDINEVIRALKKVEFNKYIVLEDFHYLPRTTQRDFAIELKALHEASDYLIIIVGVWLDENKLVQFNGDLTGRLESINADSWSHDQLREVIERGGETLGITFNSDFSDEVIAGCFDSVWIVQEVCFAACVSAGITSDMSTAVEVGANASAAALIQEVVARQSARYSKFVPAFARGDGSQFAYIYRWILASILVTDAHQLPGGLAEELVRDFVQKNCKSPGLENSHIGEALRNLSHFQAEALEVKPPILDFDESAGNLTVVDRSFLIWLEHQDRLDVLDEAGLPGSFSRGWAEQNGIAVRTGRHRT